MELRRPLDRSSGIPLYIQLEERIRILVHEGVLAVGDAMPTVRALAVDLSVNANTVARVYRDLQRDGVLTLTRGVGTFVSDGAGEALEPRAWKRLHKHIDALIDVAREGGMTAKELAQYVRIRWKERDNAQG